MNTYSEYKDWLDNLKIGDEVAYNVITMSSDEKYCIAKITKITEKTRKITVSTGLSFINGRSSSGKYSRSSYLKKVTDELKEKIKDDNIRSTILRTVDSTNLKQLSTVSLIKIYNIIKDDL